MELRQEVEDVLSDETLEIFENYDREIVDEILQMGTISFAATILSEADSDLAAAMLGGSMTEQVEEGDE